MGFGGIHIRGHSQTDFKNKKVFKRIKRKIDHKRKTANVSIESREKKPTYGHFVLIKFAVGLISIAILSMLSIALLFYINKISQDTYIDSNEVYEKNQIIEKNHAAHVLYSSAKKAYLTGSLNYAQDELVRLLKIYPKNKDALKLMYLVLNKQCEQKNQFCDQASAYHNYLLQKYGSVEC